MPDAGQGEERRHRTAVGRFLARLGARASGPGGLEVAAMLLLLFGGIPLLLVGWIVGVVLLWVSPRWRLTDKLLGTLVSSGLQLALYADAPVAVAVILFLGQLGTTVWLWRRARVVPVDPGNTAVALPAGIALGLAMFLGTIGYVGVGFGMATSCTNEFENVHRCDALYHWLEAGAIGQLVIAFAAAALIIIIRKIPQRERILSAMAVLLIPLSLAWIVITSILGGRSFGH
jgi:hypothetical protein